MDLKGAHLWRALLDERADLSDRWVLADLRWIHIDSIEDVDTWVERATRWIGAEVTRGRVAKQLRVALRDEDRPEVPRFPKAWRLSPNVMFEPDDQVPQRLGWGTRVWATEDAYHDDLGWYLGKLACNRGTPATVARSLAERARLGWQVGNPLYVRLVERLLGDDCSAAAGLPDDLRAELRELARR